MPVDIVLGLVGSNDFAGSRLKIMFMAALPLLVRMGPRASRLSSWVATLEGYVWLVLKTLRNEVG